jgi:hypothetical protein
MAAEKEQRGHAGRQFPGQLVLTSVSCLANGGHQVGIFGVQPLQCPGVAGEGQRDDTGIGLAKRHAAAMRVDQASSGGRGMQVPLQHPVYGQRTLWRALLG